jgi:hypothetical protein
MHPQHTASARTTAVSPPRPADTHRHRTSRLRHPQPPPAALVLPRAAPSVSRIANHCHGVEHGEATADGPDS